MNPLSASSLPDRLAAAWLQSYREEPNDPMSSQEFDQIPELIDECLGDDPTAPLDDVFAQAYAMIEREEKMEVAVEFLQSILPHFENITEIEQVSPRVGAVIALPIIGFKEHAEVIARHIESLDLASDMIAEGVLPKGAKVKWIPRALSPAQVGQWGADARRTLLVNAFEGGRLEDAVQTGEVASIDPAEFQMIVGVMLAFETDVENSMENPAFLFADPGDFLESENDQDVDWAIEQRIAAVDKASARMTQKIEALDIEGTIIEQPGILAESLGTLATWSLRAQQLREMNLMGLSESAISRAAEEGGAHVSLDAPNNVLSMSMELDGKMWGPYQTDWPWKSLPLEMILENLTRREIVIHPDQIEWHLDEQSMWKAAQSSPHRKWRLQ